MLLGGVRLLAAPHGADVQVFALGGASARLKAAAGGFPLVGFDPVASHVTPDSDTTTEANLTQVVRVLPEHCTLTGY